MSLYIAIPQTQPIETDDKYIQFNKGGFPNSIGSFGCGGNGIGRNCGGGSGSNNAGGGGGGSSYIRSDFTQVSHITGNNLGDGKIIIQYFFKDSARLCKVKFYVLMKNST